MASGQLGSLGGALCQCWAIGFSHNGHDCSSKPGRPSLSLGGQNLQAGRWGQELTRLLPDSGLSVYETQATFLTEPWPGALTLWLSAPVRPPPGASDLPTAAQLSELPARFLCLS